MDLENDMIAVELFAIKEFKNISKDSKIFIQNVLRNHLQTILSFIETKAYSSAFDEIFEMSNTLKKFDI